jgi:hypothetical protein
MDAERYLRQIVLVEIGEAGQRALEASTAPVLGTSAAHEVARLYAERAGFGRLDEGPADLDAASTGDVSLATPAARDVLAGSRAALRAILAATAGPR